MTVGSWAGYSSLINVNELTELVRHSPEPFRAFAALAVPPLGRALGLKRGDTVQYTYYGNVSNSGGELSESDRVPQTSVTPVSANYTIKEFGNSIPLTAKLAKLSRLEVEEDLMHALMKDLRSLENSQAYTQFTSTDWHVALSTTGDEFVTNATLTKTQDRDLDLDGLRFIRRKMRANEIPPYDGENYVLVSGVDGLDTLMFDTDVFTAVSRDSGRAAVQGECGTLAGFRLVEDNDKIAKATGDYDEAVAIGADAVLHEVAEPWYIAEDSDDFGRSNSIAYLGLMCWWKILDATTHSREHIVHVQSA